MTKLDLVRAKCALLPVMFLTIANVQRSRTQGPCCLHTWEIGELRSPDKVIGNKGRTDVDRRRRACVRRTSTRIGLCPLTQPGPNIDCWVRLVFRGAV